MRNEEILNQKSRDDWLNLIFQWIHNAEDRQMLERNLLDGLSIEAVAEEFNLSAVQTQKRLSKAKNQLFKHI